MDQFNTSLASHAGIFNCSKCLEGDNQTRKQLDRKVELVCGNGNLLKRTIIGNGVDRSGYTYLAVIPHKLLITLTVMEETYRQPINAQLSMLALSAMPIFHRDFSALASLFSSTLSARSWHEINAPLCEPNLEAFSAIAAQ